MEMDRSMAIISDHTSTDVTLSRDVDFVDFEILLTFHILQYLTYHLLFSLSDLYFLVR